MPILFLSNFKIIAHVNKQRQIKKIKAFGERLKEIRLSKSMSQEFLANKCDFEISQISRIERGIINTSIANVFIIAEQLEIKPEELFKTTEQNTK